MRQSVGSVLPIAIAIAAGAAGCGASSAHRRVQRQAEGLRLDLAETYIQKGAKEAAVPLLQRELAEKPDDVRARTLYGAVLRDLGLYPQARKELLHALALAPDYAPAHAALGILYDLEREPAAALRHHRRAVSLAPGVAAYHNNLGFSLYLAGDGDGAIAELELALALDPGLEIAYNNLGFAYGRAGRFEDAERAFRRVGGRPAALLNLSLVYEEHGQAERARSLRDEAYALAPELRPEHEQDLDLEEEIRP